MISGIFLVIFGLLSLPVYRVLNYFQASVLFISFVAASVYFYKGLSSAFKFTIAVFLLLLIAVSYNLKAEKGLIGCIPFVQGIIFIPSVFLLFLGNKGGLLLKKIGHLLFLIFTIIFAVLIIGALLNSYLADYSYTAGNLQLKNGQIDSAVLSFRNSIRKKPDLFPAYLKLCEILFKQGKYNDVISICKKGLPYLRMTADYYGPFCYYLGSSYLKSGDLDNAVIYYDKLISAEKKGELENSFSDSEEFHFFKGLFYARSKQWDDALKEYQKAFKYDPSNFLIKFKSGEAYYFLNNLDGALKIFEDLINSGFLNKDMYLYAAEIYSKKLVFDKAVLLYETYALTGIDKDINQNAYLKAYLAIGKIYETINQPDKAISYYKKLLLFPSMEPVAHMNIGNIYFKEERNYEAIIEYTKMLPVKDFTAKACFLIGEVYLSAGFNDTAIEHYKKAMALGRNRDQESYVLADRRIGHIFLSEGKFNKAVQWFKKLGKINPAKMYEEIALAYFGKGLFDKSLGICNEAYKIKSIRERTPYSLVPLYCMLLREYKKLGDIHKVVIISERLLTFNPIFVENWQEIASDLEKIYLRDKSYDNALRISRLILLFYPENTKTGKFFK